MSKIFKLITNSLLISILFHFMLQTYATTKECDNKICVTYKYIEYNNNDINYNHPNALYPIKAIQLYPIYNSNSSSSNYTVKYKTVCYPYPAYYYLYFLNYSDYPSGSSKYPKYSNYSNYSNYYYRYYNPAYLYYYFKKTSLEVKKVGYYDYKTNKFKESNF